MFLKVIYNLLMAPGFPKQLFSSLIFQFIITIQRVTQVNLVSQGVAELNAHKFSVPSSLHILLSIAFRIVVGFKWELSPDGIFACEKGKGLIYCLLSV